MAFTIDCKEFSHLTPYELYAILRLRSEVFVVEQNCVFLDMDNKDQHCSHVMVKENGIVATSKLLPPGVSFPEMSIGRVVSHASVRGTGAGKILMDKSLEFLYDKYGVGPVKIGAQYYLKRFYEDFGFRQAGEIYDEDGIDHVIMVKS